MSISNRQMSLFLFFFFWNFFEDILRIFESSMMRVEVDDNVIQARKVRMEDNENIF